jgi:hypothetical protein
MSLPSEEDVRAAVLEERVAHLIESVQEMRVEVSEMRREVQALYRWRAYLLGAAAVLSTIGALVVELLHK